MQRTLSSPSEHDTQKSREELPASAVLRRTGNRGIRQCDDSGAGCVRFAFREDYLVRAKPHGILKVNEG